MNVTIKSTATNGSMVGRVGWDLKKGEQVNVQPIVPEGHGYVDVDLPSGIQTRGVESHDYWIMRRTIDPNTGIESISLEPTQFTAVRLTGPLNKPYVIEEIEKKIEKRRDLLDREGKQICDILKKASNTEEATSTHRPQWLNHLKLEKSLSDDEGETDGAAGVQKIRQREGAWDVRDDENGFADDDVSEVEWEGGDELKSIQIADDEVGDQEFETAETSKVRWKNEGRAPGLNAHGSLIQKLLMQEHEEHGQKRKGGRIAQAKGMPKVPKSKAKAEAKAKSVPKGKAASRSNANISSEILIVNEPSAKVKPAAKRRSKRQFDDGISNASTQAPSPILKPPEERQNKRRRKVMPGDEAAGVPPTTPESLLTPEKIPITPEKDWCRQTDNRTPNILSDDNNDMLQFDKVHRTLIEKEDDTFNYERNNYRTWFPAHAIHRNKSDYRRSRGTFPSIFMSDGTKESERTASFSSTAPVSEVHSNLSSTTMNMMDESEMIDSLMQMMATPSTSNNHGGTELGTISVPTTPQIPNRHSHFEIENETSISIPMTPQIPNRHSHFEIENETSISVPITPQIPNRHSHFEIENETSISLPMTPRSLPTTPRISNRQSHNEIENGTISVPMTPRGSHERCHDTLSEWTKSSPVHLNVVDPLINLSAAPSVTTPRSYKGNEGLSRGEPVPHHISLPKEIRSPPIEHVQKIPTPMHNTNRPNHDLNSSKRTLPESRDAQLRVAVENIKRTAPPRKQKEKSSSQKRGRYNIAAASVSVEEKSPSITSLQLPKPQVPAPSVPIDNELPSLKPERKSLPELLASQITYDEQLKYPLQSTYPIQKSLPCTSSQITNYNQQLYNPLSSSKSLSPTRYRNSNDTMGMSSHIIQIQQNQKILQESLNRSKPSMKYDNKSSFSPTALLTLSSTTLSQENIPSRSSVPPVQNNNSVGGTSTTLSQENIPSRSSVPPIQKNNSVDGIAPHKVSKTNQSNSVVHLTDTELDAELNTILDRNGVLQDVINTFQLNVNGEEFKIRVQTALKKLAKLKGDGSLVRRRK